MWSLESPVYLFLFLLIFPAVYYRRSRRFSGGRIPFSFCIWPEDSFSSPNRGLQIILAVSSIFFWLGFSFLIIALAGPSYIEKERIYLTRGIDIIIVLDESPSMAAQDFSPENRFESAKRVIRRFISNRENDPVGIVSFGKEAALRVPPTIDYGMLFDRLDSLRIMDMGNGTAIGMGIAVAVLHLQRSTAEKQIIILITDGENNAGEIMPESAAEIAAQMGIKIYSIGIGFEGEVPLEYTDPETGKIYRGQYKSGFNETLLKKMADISGGKYFHALSPGALNSILKTIDSIESREKLVKIKTKARQEYRKFIIIGFLLIMFNFIIRKIIFKEFL